MRERRGGRAVRGESSPPESTTVGLARAPRRSRGMRPVPAAGDDGRRPESAAAAPAATAAAMRERRGGRAVLSCAFACPRRAIEDPPSGSLSA